MSVLLRKQYSTIKKEKLSEQAKSVLKSMYETTNGFKDAKATRKIKPKFEAFYNKLKESKPEAIVGGKAKSKAAPKKSADDFKAARDRRKKQTGVPKDKSAVEKDAVRPAISKRGKRTSKAGNTYYEYRDNRLDKNPSKYPMLAKGGEMAKGGGLGFNQYGEPYGYEESESDSVYEIHHKPEMHANNPYLIWDKIDGVYIAEFPNNQRALHFIENKKYGYAKGGETKVPNTYIPNRDVQELMVVLKEKSIKLKGSDILDGVYAKNSALKGSKSTKGAKSTTSTLSVDEIFDNLVSKAKKLDDDGAAVKKEDIKQLIDAGYDSKDIELMYLGVNILDPKIDVDYDRSGLMGYTEEGVTRNVKRLVDAAKNNSYEIGLKYPEFNWASIIKKYNISKKGKEINGDEMKFTNETEYYVYTVFEGDKVAVGTSTNRIRIKDGKKQPEDDYYKKDPKELAAFTGGYWGVVTSSKEVMYDILGMILSQKGKYVKDINVFVNGLGGVGYEELEKNDIKYEQGGYMAKGGETHRLDSIFEDGGEIAEGNLEMAMSNVKAIEHHAMELKSILDENTSIEAWVVAKLERAETDLSDVTHYIDGLKGEEVESDTYFAKGGQINMNKHIWEGWTVGSFIEELDIEFRYHPKFKSRDEVKKWAMESQPYYKKYIPEVVDYYWEKNQEKYADGGYMAKGGEVKARLLAAQRESRSKPHIVVNNDEMVVLKEFKNYNSAKKFVDEYLDENEDKYGTLSIMEKESSYASDYMAKGGGIYSSEELYIVKVFDGKSGELLDMSRRVWAKNLSQAQTMAIEDYEYDMKAKYGDHLRFTVEEAPSMMAKGGRLSRKQKQLDLNKNGKLDSQDFKMLRAGRKNARKK